MHRHPPLVQRLFQRHGLDAPDGRALHAYRLDEDSFAELKDWLRGQAAACQNDLSLLSPRDCGLFVLYAAEWWRRKYDGGHWRWNPIFAGIGVPSAAWTPSTVQYCVQTGLRYWRLGLGESGGLRYLGAIARQGGLPVSLIAEARGHIGQVLGQVLRLAVPNSPRYSLRAWIDSLQSRLPASYRSEQTLDLLTDLAEAVLRLSHEAQLTSSQDAIAKLDACRPAWRDHLPLRLDDTQAHSLIEQLIGDAVQRPAASERNKIHLRRWLEPKPDDDTLWTLRSTLELPDKVAADDLLQLFEIPDHVDLGRLPTLTLIASSHTLEWPLQRLTGHNTFRIPTQTHNLRDEIAAAGHRLQLQRQNTERIEANLRGGDGLDPHLPWVFEDPPDLTKIWLQQGGGGVTTDTALLAIPEGWSVTSDGPEAGESKLAAYLESPIREIHRVRGALHIESPERERWRIRTAQADAKPADYYWQGQRCWLDLERPAQGFFGRPVLYEGGQRIPEHELEWRPDHGSGYYGPATVSHRVQDEIRHRSRVLVLPEMARIEITPQNADQGDIHLHGWGLASVRLLDRTDVLHLHHEIQGADSTLHIGLQQGTDALNTPAEVRIELAWLGNPAPARLRLPFPGKGARAYDASGRRLEDQAWLAQNQLAGSRVIAVGLKGHPRLLFEARRPHEPLHPVARDECRLNAMADSQLEIRLQDHGERIAELLSVSDLIDGWVLLRLEDHFGQTLLNLRLSRYNAKVQATGPLLELRAFDLTRVDTTELERMELHALRLESPGDEALNLEPCRSEGVATGAWNFDPANQEPGTWLIYAASNSPLPLRPALIPIQGENSRDVDGDYAHAIGLADRAEREYAMDKLIAAMAQDFTHPGWNEFERIASQVGHVPLAALDVWRCLARSPRAMAALALRLGQWPDHFVDRFSRELPFDWALVTYPAWRDAARCLGTQCEQWFGPVHGRNELERRLDELNTSVETDYPAQGKLFGILRSEILNQANPEVTAMRHGFVDEAFREQLFGGEDAEVQRLLRVHADDTDWPSTQEIYQLIDRHRKEDGRGADLLADGYNDFRHSAINFPILLALRCALHIEDDTFSNPTRLHDLRVYRAFDPDWFDTAFDLTIGRCLPRGFLED